MQKDLKNLQIQNLYMCEFTVKKKWGSTTEKVGEDVIFFQYTESGESRLADIFGRLKVSSINGFVYEINMLENRHDITIIESDLVPYFVRFMEAIQSDSQKDKKKHADELILQIQKSLE